MVPELGHFALILGLFFAIAVSVLPMLGSYTRSNLLMRVGAPLSVGCLVFVTMAFACLVWSFLQDDFSVAFVANHSNQLLPIQYKFTATWGGHEGSLLLWIFWSALWLCAVSLFARGLPLAIHARVVSVMAITLAGILIFTLLTSNPFERILPGAPLDGRDLNPLLQDVGFIIHPPILYMGYSGFAVAFAFAITALLSGHCDAAWARWTRPWTNVAWGFLTLGVGLGSWWAYYELGWGFWWGWDPTENNVLVPWLTGTALVHSLAVTEKRGLFKTWTILLAILTFCLNLFATFITRSGIVNSVHAFANDSERGMFLLLYIAVIVVASLFLYGLRAPTVASMSNFKASSRETFLLSNNIILVILAAVVLIGTLYPMFTDFMGWGMHSVGAPYFNFFWVIFVVPLCLLLGVANLSQWKQTATHIFKKYLPVPLVLSLVLGVVVTYFYSDEFHWGGALTVFVASWVITTTLAGLLRQIRTAADPWQGLKRLSVSYYAMVVAHIGVGLLTLSAGMTTIYAVERNIILLPGETKSLFGYEWQFTGVEQLRGENYFAEQATVMVSRHGETLAVLQPEKRHYMSGVMSTTEADIEGNLWRDLYVSLGEATEPKSQGGWVFTVYVKPFMVVLWIGLLLMSAGGFMALIDKRYRMSSRVRAMNSTDASLASRGAI